MKAIFIAIKIGFFTLVMAFVTAFLAGLFWIVHAKLVGSQNVNELDAAVWALYGFLIGGGLGLVSSSFFEYHYYHLPEHQSPKLEKKPQKG